MMDVIELNEKSFYDREEYERLGVELIVTWYETGSWEGWGHSILYKEGKFDCHYLGHCSCYGPWDEYSFTPAYDTLEETIEVMKKDDWSDSAHYLEIIAEVKKWLEGSK